MNPRIEVYGVEIDILLFVLFFDITVYFLYTYIYGKNIKQMASQDLKVSIISMLIVSINYYGTGIEVNLFGYELNWFWYYVILDSFIGISLMYFYMKHFNLKMKDFQ